MTRHVVLAGLVIVAGAVAAAGAQELAAASRAGVAASGIEVSPDLWNVLLNETQDHFFRADGEITDGELKKAADEVARAAAFMMIEAARATDVDRKRLDKAANDVQELATKLYSAKQEGVVSTRVIHATFAEACLALAHHYRELAEAARLRQDRQTLGATAYAAADYLAYGSTWAVRPIDERVINQARAAATQVMTGGGGLNEFDQTILDALDGQLKSMDDKLLKEVLEQPQESEKEPVK
jgi:hypothetical protein